MRRTQSASTTAGGPTPPALLQEHAVLPCRCQCRGVHRIKSGSGARQGGGRRWQTGGLKVCIAEVTNTPWGARVTFLFDPAGQDVPKALHVSPFMDMASTWCGAGIAQPPRLPS